MGFSFRPNFCFNEVGRFCNSFSRKTERKKAGIFWTKFEIFGQKAGVFGRKKEAEYNKLYDVSRVVRKGVRFFPVLGGEWKK